MPSTSSVPHTPHSMATIDIDKIKTLTPISNIIDVPGMDPAHVDPFGLAALDALGRLVDLGTLRNELRFDNMLDACGHMVLWDSQAVLEGHDGRHTVAAGRTDWRLLPAADMKVGTFVELPMLRYYPTVQVVTAVDRGTGAVTTRALARLSRIMPQHLLPSSPPESTVIVEQDESSDLALIETRFASINAPVHVIVQKNQKGAQP